jgi:hypothetical protein
VYLHSLTDITPPIAARDFQFGVRGLTPQYWLAVEKFWEMYFLTAGAELYSTECEVQR